MAETQTGDYKIVSGTETEVLTAMSNDQVTKGDVLGFQHDGSNTVAVMYEV